MKLGIAVVYLVEAENARLLDLHFEWIERHTSVPYRIYAGANRLAAPFRAVLETHPRLTLCPLEPTAARGTPEHAQYLDQLVAAAVDDGSTHVAILHVDSFPVRASWALDLAAQLTERCAVAAVCRDEMRDHKPCTAGMLFGREFYLRHRPRLLVDAEEARSPAYRRYAAEIDPIPDSGVGYGFALHRLGLTWHPLPKSNRAQDHPRVGAVYGDTFFHLGFAARRGEVAAGALARVARVHPLARRVAELVVPKRVWRGEASGAWRWAISGLASSRMLSRRPDPVDGVRARLLGDPDAYVAHLRTGG